MLTELERIEKIMENENLKASDLATEIGVKLPTLSHVFKGRNKPSLEVLKKILERYPSISSDWLILGQGPMYRDLSKSHHPSLFDNEEVSDSISDSYTGKTVNKVTNDFSQKQLKTETPSVIEQKHEPIIKTIEKTIERKIVKIIVYYEDNTFQEFDGK